MMGSRGAEIRTRHCVAVLASFNEVHSIAPVLAELREAADVLAPSGVRVSVVLVDDASPDGTAEVAKAWAAQLELEIDVVQGPQAGLGRAMSEGMRRALTHDADAIVTLDADGQHNATYLPTLHRAFLARQADLLIGSRWVRGGTSPGTSIFRTVGSRAGNRIFRAVSGVRGVKDATTSFRIYSPRLVRYLLDAPSQRFEGYSYFSTNVALAEAAGFAISEVPINFRPRYSGSSKFGLGPAVEFFATLKDLRAERRTGHFSGSEDDYRAKDELEVLSQAREWNSFIIETLLSDVDRGGVSQVLEVGAGIGGITVALRRSFPDAQLTCLEPDPENFGRLAERFEDDAAVTVQRDSVERFARDHPSSQFDLIIYVNVLEHIRDDDAELARAAGLLRESGRIAILVPAMPGLYGPIDFKSGHYRRYSTEELTAKIQGAGLVATNVSYRDPLGVVPYWVNYRLLNKSKISSRGLWLFDHVLVPAIRLTHAPGRDWPVGKNVVGVAVRAPNAVDGRTER